ncbi:MAG TPA: TerB family tellurite resistance protein [Bacteroidales bacterium]|nr:TerB family tellurite resistance protein [Bacteroidales bacterium]
MGKFAKWIGGGLGFAVGGPIGALFGFLIGSVVDNTEVHSYSYSRPPEGNTPGAFGVSLVVLIAAVMKADGQVLKSELDYVKKFFIAQFGPESAREALTMLRDLLKKDIPLNDVCMQIKHGMDYSSRLQLLHILFNISAADGRFDKSEVDVISNIASLLGVTSNDFESIKNMFIPSTDASYRILEIDSTATDEEVKKAYRKMALKYHPDKVSHLGEDYRKNAEEKIKAVNEAYDKIKKERNLV